MVRTKLTARMNTGAIAPMRSFPKRICEHSGIRSHQKEWVKRQKKHCFAVKKFPSILRKKWTTRVRVNHTRRMLYWHRKMVAEARQCEEDKCEAIYGISLHQKNLLLSLAKAYIQESPQAQPIRAGVSFEPKVTELNKMLATTFSTSPWLYYEGPIQSFCQRFKRFSWEMPLWPAYLEGEVSISNGKVELLNPLEKWIWVFVYDRETDNVVWKSKCLFNPELGLSCLGLRKATPEGSF
jgi:hypothetical protein